MKNEKDEQVKEPVQEIKCMMIVKCVHCGDEHEVEKGREWWTYASSPECGHFWEIVSGGHEGEGGWLISD